MPDYLNQESRERIAVFLPNALSKALSSYHEFTDRTIIEDPKDPKEFAAYHSAAKVAIAHVELLMKMAKWSELSSKDVDDDNKDDISSMIAKAEEEVKVYKDRQGNIGDANE